MNSDALLHSAFHQFTFMLLEQKKSHSPQKEKCEILVLICGNYSLNWHDNREELYEIETFTLLNTAYSTIWKQIIVVGFSQNKW